MTDTSAPEPDGHDDELTVEDILDTEQSDDAASAEQSSPQEDLLSDLKRVQAEYANYRRRTEEQRQIEVERAKGSVASDLLPVLDDLDRAEKHGDLSEGSPLAAIAEKLRQTAIRIGLQGFGADGEVFNPQRHEAIFQKPTAEVTESTVIEVVELGYQLGDVQLRPAKVVVAVPEE